MAFPWRPSWSRCRRPDRRGLRIRRRQPSLRVGQQRDKISARLRHQRAVVGINRILALVRALLWRPRLGTALRQLRDSGSGWLYQGAETGRPGRPGRSAAAATATAATTAATSATWGGDGSGSRRDQYDHRRQQRHRPPVLEGTHSGRVNGAAEKLLGPGRMPGPLSKPDLCSTLESN